MAILFVSEEAETDYLFANILFLNINAAIISLDGERNGKWHPT